MGRTIVAGDSAHTREPDPREAFYEQHHRRLAAFIQRRVADTGVAEQIEQQTWAHMMSRWDTLRLPEVVLMRIALRRIVDWYETKGRSDLTPGDQIVGDILDHSQLRANWADAADPGTIVPSRVDLQRAMAMLPSRQRQVLTLLGVDRLSRKQVAGLLDIGEETVKTLYAQAKATMRTNPALAGYQRRQAITQEVTG